MSKRLHILVIDDDPIFRNSVAAALRSEFFISLAEDGQDAYNKAVQNLPQLAILDMVMPGYDGLATMRLFRRDLRLASIPFVVVTGDGRRATVMACAQAGVKAYLLKTSLKFSDLANTIRRLLGQEVNRSPEPDVALPTGTHRGSVDWRHSAHEPDLSSFDRS